jgi:hypothetical protein
MVKWEIIKKQVGQSIDDFNQVPPLSERVAFRQVSECTHRA